MAILVQDNGKIGPLHFARETYIRKMAKYGLLPIFVSGAMPREMVDELYDMTAGVLCMGGTDIDPKLYGEEMHPKTEAKEPLRDELEIYVIQKAMADNKPFLGICRGLQALAVAAGGKLVQHVPEIATEEHGATGYDDLGDGSKGHSINVRPGSFLHQLVGKDEIRVNTAHHQAVSEPGRGLSVSATAPDGVIEAIENGDSAYFCMGVQSHPEAAEGELEPVFKAFAEAIAK